MGRNKKKSHPVDSFRKKQKKKEQDRVIIHS